MNLKVCYFYTVVSHFSIICILISSCFKVYFIIPIFMPSFQKVSLCVFQLKSYVHFFACYVPLSSLSPVILSSQYYDAFHFVGFSVLLLHPLSYIPVFSSANLFMPIAWPQDCICKLKRLYHFLTKHNPTPRTKTMSLCPVTGCLPSYVIKGDCG